MDNIWIFRFLFANVCIVFLLACASVDGHPTLWRRRSRNAAEEDSSIPNVIPLGSTELEIVADRHRVKCINTLADEYRNLIGRHIRGKNAILVDTVDHPNVGDNIIQYGEIKLLGELGIQVREPCSNWDCNLTLLAERVAAYDGESVVLIHGGGNLGDVWRGNTEFRFRVAREFPNTPIVLLPQSVFYIKEREAFREGELYGRHNNVTVYLRDYTSLDYIRTHFKETPSHLCPDAAFMVGALNTSRCRPHYDVFILTRKDLEKREDIGNVEDALQALKKVNISAASGDWWDWEKFFPHRRTPTERLAWAEWRLNMGADLLCLGRVIITDRLHATILSTLLGLPHVYIDNYSKKVSMFVDSNFGRHEDCKPEYLRGWKASSWSHASKIVAAMFKKEI